MLVFRYFLDPGSPFLGVRIDEVVEHGALRGELDSLVLRHPPLGELNTIINQLEKDKY